MTRPLIFSAPMVRAILDGRKTMTRRVLKPQPGEPVFDGERWLDRARERTAPHDAGERSITPYAVGDRLWVREAWQHARKRYCRCPQGAEPQPCDDWMEGTGCRSDRGDVIYRADAESLAFWRSPIHMPRWASRLTLIVESVRVERLQEITEADAEREGVEKPILPHWPGLPFRSAFRGLWLDLHGPVSWEANPWVAVIGFRVVRENIDAPSASARIMSTE